MMVNTMEGICPTKDYYDVVIVGAGIAGLSCANALANSDLDILIIEKSANFYEKPCAAGITYKDLTYIPRRYILRDFSRVLFEYGEKRIRSSIDEGGLIATIDRQQYLKDMLKKVRTYKNVTVLIPEIISQISSSSIILLSGRKISFSFLVGADGSNSIVRKFLGLPSVQVGLALQYIIPRPTSDFVIRIDPDIGSYCWVFPYYNSTSVGCGGKIFDSSPRRLREKLEEWIMNKNFSLSGSTFQASLINCDYRGHRFDNIFLIGDAAGITSGLTGKGIYPAIFMGHYISDKIQGRKADEKTFKKLLLKKNVTEFVASLCNSHFRKKFISAGFSLLSTQTGQRMLLRVAG